MAYRSFWKFWHASTPATIRRLLKPRHPDSRIALADPGFTFKPDLQWLALRLYRQGDIYRGGKFFECLLCQRLGFRVLGPHREGAKPERRKLFDDRPLRIGCPYFSLRKRLKKPEYP